MTDRTWKWLKLPLDLLQSPTYGRLSDRLYRRATELRLVAGQRNAGGALPPLQDVAWTLRVDFEELEQDCILLEEVGILDRVGQTWRFVSFEKDQSPSDPTAAERMRRYRAKEEGQEIDRNVTRNVTRELRVEAEGEGDVEQESVVASTTQKPLADAPPLSSQGKDPIQELLEGEGMSSKEAARLSREHNVPEIMAGLAIAKSYAYRHPTRNFAGILHTAIQERWTSDGERESVT